MRLDTIGEGDDHDDHSQEDDDHDDSGLYCDSLGGGATAGCPTGVRIPNPT